MPYASGPLEGIVSEKRHRELLEREEKEMGNKRNRRLYVVMTLKSWASLTGANDGRPITMVDEESVGFLTVYANKRKAKRDFPKSEVMELLAPVQDQTEAKP